MLKNLLIIGKNGQISKEYEMSQSMEGWLYFFLDNNQINTLSISSIEEAIADFQPTCILNLSSYNNIEKAEKEETEKAFNINALGVKNIATVCFKHHIPLIHISTNNVFSGINGSHYTETDNVNPINQYGRTKLLGEKWIQETHDWYYILRISWLYSNQGKNFYSDTIDSSQERTLMTVPSDQYSSPTSSKEVCRAIDNILLDLEKSKSGIYHFAGDGRCSLHEFASEIFSQSKIPAIVQPTTSPNSFISKDNYLSSFKFSETFNYTPLKWKIALTEMLLERRNLPIKVGDKVISDNQQFIVVSTDWLRKLARVALVQNLQKSVEVPFEFLQLHNRI